MRGPATPWGKTIRPLLATKPTTRSAAADKYVGDVYQFGLPEWNYRLSSSSDCVIRALGNEELETINEELRMRTGELNEAQIFLEGVMSSVAAAVVVLDTGLKVRTWNSGAEDIWGLRASEVIGQPFFSLDFGLPAHLIRDTVTKCMSSAGQAQHAQVSALNRRGRAITCAISCSPLNEARDGVVLLMEEQPAAGEQPATREPA
jgi:PAS domain S-box-containing protein